jgi:hypothetical protein
MRRYMTNNNNLTYFIGSLIFSLIGGILLLVMDFGGWYAYNGYLGIRTWAYIGLNELPAGLLFIIPALFLFYCTWISLKALQNTNITPNKNSIRLGFYLSIVVFLLALIGGIIFILTLGDVTDWWFDGGFYGGLLGGLFTSIFMYFTLKSMN